MPRENMKSKTLPTLDTVSKKPVHVWLLLDDRPGHATQVKGLAQNVGWQAEAIDLKFNRLNIVPNPLLGSRLLSLESGSAKKLLQPFPDIVVGMGRRIVPVARWIKKQSGGATKIVLLGRKAVGKSSDIDYVVSCVHFNQLPRENCFELMVPPTQVNAEILAEARKARPNPLSDMSRPRVVLLVGGPTAQHRFDATDASQMVSEVSRVVTKFGGGLAIVTSRRTPAETVKAMGRTAPKAHMHVWQAGAKDNPYLSYLANADLLVVTGESESMLAEAAATRLPLTIYRLQAKPRGMKNYLASAMRLKADQVGILAKFCRQLLLAGWVIPPRELALMHRSMEQQGMACVFDGSLNTQKPEPSNEFTLLARQLAALVAD